MNGALDRGIIDLFEVARLIGVAPETVARWSKRLVPPEHGFAYSFADLISLKVIAALRKREHPVPLKRIETAVRYLGEELDDPHPFARQELSTSGHELFAELDGLIDVGQGGQLPFTVMVANSLERVEFGPDGVAQQWRPVDRVLLDPRIQTGSPCIAGTRTPTSLLADLVDDGEAVEDLADDFELELDDVLAALEFEGMPVPAGV